MARMMLKIFIGENDWLIKDMININLPWL